MRTTLFSCFISIAVGFYATNLQAEETLYTIYKHMGVSKVSTWHRKRPIPLDWKSLVPEKYSAISLGPIPKKYMEEFKSKKNMFLNAEYSFLLPSPALLMNKYFYLISDTGVNEIKIANIETVVRFRLNQESTDVTSISHFGYLIPDKQWSHKIGFVLVSDSKLELSALRYTVKSGTIVEDSIIDKKIELGSLGYKVLSSFSLVNKKNKKYLNFISLKSDPKAFCSFRAYIITNDDEPKVVISNNSGCDV